MPHSATFDVIDATSPALEVDSASADGVLTRTIVDASDVARVNQVTMGFVKIKIIDSGTELPTGDYFLPAIHFFDWSDYALLARYDASDAASITLVSNVISQLDDLSGNGNHLVQATAASRPGVVSFGGFQAADFDGSDDYLEVDSLSPGDAVSPATLMIVFQTDATGVTQTLFDGPDATDRWFIRKTTSDNLRILTDSGGGTAIDTGAHILAVKMLTSSTFEYFIDGVSSGEISGTVPDLAGITLGAFHDEISNFLDGKIAEVVVADVPLTNDEINQIAQYWAQKYSNLPEWANI